MPTSPWSLTPLRQPYQTQAQQFGQSANMSAPLSGSYQLYQPPQTTQAPISSSRPSQTTAGGGTVQPMASSQPQTSTYGPAVNNALNSTNWSGTGQPGTNQQTTQGTGSYGTSNQGYDRQLAPQATGTSSLWGSAGEAANQFYGTPEAQQHRGALSSPGAYENWYAQNASRYNQPTALSSYYQSVQGRVQGQRFQPNASQDAYASAQQQMGGVQPGVDNARYTSQRLQYATPGEGTMTNSLNYLQGRNNASDYYGQTRSFYDQSGDIERYYDQTGGQFQQAGQGEQYASGLLNSGGLNDVYNNRLVGGELDYFRPELRGQSYSEQLYESGNQGLNKYYDLENKRAQEALADRAAAMGTFTSSDTLRGMADIDSQLGAAQARDMAGLASQADQERRARADLLFGAAGQAADEELARGGLMLEGANTGLQMDRDAIGRLVAGGNLANQSSQYALDRITSGQGAANTADMSRFTQGRDIANVGNMLSGRELERLQASGAMGLAGDTENRQRIESLYGMGADTDRLGLDAQAAELDWLGFGGDLAGNVDQSNLSWLNSGGDAARLAQDMYQQRERYGFLDPLSLGSAMAGTYSTMSGANSTAEAQQRTEAVNLLMQREGLSAAEAERRAQEWASTGTLLAQLAALRNR